MNELTKIPHSDVWKIIEEFDFEKVHHAMVATDWKWTTHNPNDSQETEIPSIQTLIKTASRMLKDAAEIDGGCSTGGFTVNRFKREDGTDFLCLTFTLESADSEYPQ